MGFSKVWGSCFVFMGPPGDGGKPEATEATAAVPSVGSEQKQSSACEQTQTYSPGGRIKGQK